MPHLALAASSILIAGALGLACSHPGPSAPVSPAGDHARVVALISATAEWKIIVAQLPGAAVHDTPFGQYLTHRMAGEDVVFFHGGYGKISAAGSTQYAVDRWHPTLLVNLGTCGGFGERKVGDVMLVSETYVYDIVELMGSADEAIEDHHTRLDIRRWPARLADRVVTGAIVSADRDLDPASVPALQTRYHVTVGDWESGAIAWVAARNRTPLIILRGVTDVIDATGHNETYNALAEWQRRSAAVMAGLVGLLGEALPDLVN